MTPTLEDVKEYFKDAEIVECLFDRIHYNISNCKIRMNRAEKYEAYLGKDVGYARLYKFGKYAKIIKYKEPMYTITKEQILELHEIQCTSDKDDLLKELFPDVFKKELVVGKWYCRGEELARWNDKKITYGFVMGKFISYMLFSEEIGREATEEEVKTALIAEAKKIGFKGGVYIKRSFDNDLFDCCINPYKFARDPEYFYNEKHDYIEYKGYVIYSKGQWAEIIPTMTQKEAEEKLNVKII